MNKGISQSKTEPIPGTSLEVLHHESKEWLSSIEFWRYELHFLVELLYWMEPLDKADKAFSKLLNRFEGMVQKLDAELEVGVIDHEKQLFDLLAMKEGSSGSYRERHQVLKTIVASYSQEYKLFKTSVFEYIKLYNEQ